MGALRYAAGRCSRDASAWNACPASWTIVRTSLWVPAAFMKMNGTRASLSVCWYPPGALPRRLPRSSKPPRSINAKSSRIRASNRVNNACVRPAEVASHP